MTTSLTPFDFLLITLAAYYIAEVVTTKAGPFDIFANLRLELRWGVLACIWCFIPYVAIVLFLALLFIPCAIMIIEVFAICGAAMMLRSYTGSGHGG